MAAHRLRAVRDVAVVVILVFTGITVSTTDRAGAVVSTIDRAVVASADDAEESSVGSVSLTSSDLELVTDGTAVQTVGMRFTALGIPVGASISAAWVQFETDEVSTGTTSLQIRAEAADTAAPFLKTTANLSSRARTSAAVAWTPATWPTIQVAGADQRTPNLAPLVQEVVNRPGWVSGNAIAVLITGTGRRTAEAFDGTRAPVLHVEITGGSPVNAVPSVNAGPNQIVELATTATLAGSVGDDGLPVGAPVTATWTQVSGPGTTTFAYTSAPATTATFNAPGLYVLRLSAFDTELTGFDDIAIDVQILASTVSQVHYTFGGPTSVTLDWRGGPGDLRYGPTTVYSSTAQALPPAVTPVSSVGPFWEASITGLDPATTYHYSISGGPDATFATPPTGAMRFDALGDIGSSLLRPSINAVHTAIAADQPSFVLALGDLTYANKDGPAGVDRHFDDVMAWSLRAAYLPAWGNHEWDTPLADDLRNYKGRFALPHAQTSVGAPALGCCEDDWGWFDAGGVRFISYPERYTAATWTEWSTAADLVMASAQADPSIHFVVTYGHRPAYSTGNHSGEVALATILDRLGETYSKYVVNLNGHSHQYERFLPIHNVVHVTGGSGGRSLEATSTPPDARTAYRALHVARLRVDVTDNAMRIDAVCGPANAAENVVCPEGSILDSVTIGAPSAFNRAPVVNAGANAAVVRPNEVSLTGTVTDDGLPLGNVLTHAWTQLSGPGPVAFADASALATTVSFPVAGTYVLRLIGSDGEMIVNDDMTVVVTEPGAASLDRAVATSADDAEESSSGSVSLTSSDLELVTDGTVVQTVGVRFGNLSIPSGAVVTNAYLQFETDEVSTGATALTVRGQLADNPATFAKLTGNLSSRPRTVASIPWSPASWPTIQVRGVDQRTPDVSAIVRELIARPGWVSGNAMVFLITGSGRRTSEAFDGTRAPVLHVEYTVG